MCFINRMFSQKNMMLLQVNVFTPPKKRKRNRGEKKERCPLTRVLWGHIIVCK